MGALRLTLRVGGDRSLPAKAEAKTFVPKFPDPSPLAVISRLPMALGRAMGVQRLLPPRWARRLSNKKSSPIESTPGIPASTIGQRQEAVGPVERGLSPFPFLGTNQGQPQPGMEYPQNPSLNRLWRASHHLHLVGSTEPTSEPTLFDEEIPSLSLLESTGELLGISTDQLSVVIRIGSILDSIWSYRNPVTDLNKSTPISGGTFVRSGNVDSTPLHNDKPLRLVVDNERTLPNPRGSPSNVLE